MDVTKAPPVDPGSERGPAAPAQQQLPPPLTAPPIEDRVDIQPLDLVGALLILVAEVRAGLLVSGLPQPPAQSPLTGPIAAAIGQNPGRAPGEASQLLVRLFLQALPEEELSDETLPDERLSDSDASVPEQRAVSSIAQMTDARTVAAAQLESALSDALDKGVAAVAGWRDVPPSVVAAVEDTRAVVLAVVGGESVNALWLRPEWLGLAPRLERYWRRRRVVRRGLSDPDHERRDGRDGREDRDDERGPS